MNRSCEFRVYQERQPGPSNMRQSQSQLSLSNQGEAIDSRIDQKALKPPHTFGRESFDITLIVVNHATPGRPIDAAFVACRLTLGF
jgi:hypothetical protein